MALCEAHENVQPMSLTCNSVAFQFHHDVSFPLHDEIKTTLFEFVMNSCRNWMRSVSHLRCKRLVVTIERKIFFCSCNGRTWDWCTKQANVSLVCLEFPRSNVVMLAWCQQSQSAKSGEQGGWSIFVMDFLARNLRPYNASCTGALSWRRTHLSDPSSSLFLLSNG
jgi:hypothetical protein